jgi:hypothetical protein
MGLPEYSSDTSSVDVKIDEKKPETKVEEV